jgi:hypothetical protein
MNLTTLSVFDSPVRAHLAKVRLESEGIAAYLFDEHMIGLNPLLTVSLGGIKLKVNEEDLAGARKLLRTRALELVESEADCPLCDSTDVETHISEVRSLTAIWSFVISLCTFTYPLHRDQFNHCRSCGYKFRNET